MGRMGEERERWNGERREERMWRGGGGWREDENRRLKMHWREGWGEGRGRRRGYSNRRLKMQGRRGRREGVASWNGLKSQIENAGEECVEIGGCREDGGLKTQGRNGWEEERCRDDGGLDSQIENLGGEV